MNILALIIDQVKHHLDRISLQIPSELGQPPSKGPFSPFRLYLDRALGRLGGFRRLGDPRPLRCRGLLRKSQAPGPFWCQSSRRSPHFGYDEQGSLGNLSSSCREWSQVLVRHPNRIFRYHLEILQDVLNIGA
jgi:hypothetical protein